MADREVARALNLAADQAARETRMLHRGVIAEVLEDGRCMVRLPGGGLVKLAAPTMFEPSKDQPITFFRQGSVWEIQTPSAFGGGLGSPYAEP